jgi:hypothetical protein
MNNYLITSQENHTPPFEWSQGIFQRYSPLPISGNFPVGNNFEGNMQCVNNQTGRGFYANPCGYWELAKPQFAAPNVMPIEKGNFTIMGNMYPTMKEGKMSRPVFNRIPPYTRIGENYVNR